MSDTNETNETKTWAQLYALRGGWRPLRRDGHEYEQECGHGHKYQSDSPKPTCPICPHVFAEVDIEAERSAFRRQDRRMNWFGMLVIIAALWLFAWALCGGLEAQGKIDGIQEVRQ